MYSNYSFPFVDNFSLLQLAGKFKKVKSEVDDVAIEAADMRTIGEETTKKLEAATGGLLRQLMMMQNDYSHHQADLKRNNVIEMEQIKSQVRILYKCRNIYVIHFAYFSKLNDSSTRYRNIYSKCKVPWRKRSQKQRKMIKLPIC
jgi:hypothetical protein